MNDFYREGLETAELARIVGHEIDNGVTDTSDLLSAVQQHIPDASYQTVTSTVALMVATGSLVCETFSKRVRKSE
ncbi:hypothetical protein QM806_14270 [Rhodococcus sp. IEGM 1351]|uniref:hypothetical protein n=1 Tax=Rhodococcus sp. IEGM 1351 TaxID=3047089 RepID=UPI0024B7D124|nr:hypothetical protein [Rhodococcus sp. IEGM 1351]MDI9936584.1 hypothetical protein [Rhodococcus sp. IEGM 1351]